MFQTAQELASWIVVQLIFTPGTLELTLTVDPQVPDISLSEYIFHIATEIDNFIPVYRSEILTKPITEDMDFAAHAEFTEKLEDLLHRLIPAFKSWDGTYFDEIFGKVYDYLDIRCQEENIRDE
jgi:hypothetical protein